MFYLGESMHTAIRASAARSRRSIAAEIEHLADLVLGTGVPISVGDESEVFEGGGRATAFLPAALYARITDLAAAHDTTDSKALRSVLAHGLAVVRHIGCVYCAGRQPVEERAEA